MKVQAIDETGLVGSRYFAKILIVAIIGGTILLEGGSLVFNRLQAQDIADQAAAEAGIVYFASRSTGSAESRAETYVQENGATFVKLTVDETAKEISVTLTKTARTFLVQSISSLRDLRLAEVTGTAPLRT